MTDHESLARTLAEVNESMIAEQVKAGKMPVAVLDHLGHLKNDVYSLGCEFCLAKQ